MNVMRFLGRFLDDGRLGVVVAAVVVFVVAPPLAVLLLPQRHVGEFFLLRIHNHINTSVHTPNVVQ